MKLNQAGWDYEDLNEIITLCYLACKSLEDSNGAGPPSIIKDVDGVTDIPNPNYVRYIRLHSIVQLLTVFSREGQEYDATNNTVTDPIVVLQVRAGGF